MEKDFDLSQFDEYREDNRREVKKADGGLVELLFLVSKKIKMVVGELPDSRMHLSYARNFGII